VGYGPPDAVAVCGTGTLVRAGEFCSDWDATPGLLRLVVPTAGTRFLLLITVFFIATGLGTPCNL